MFFLCLLLTHIKLFLWSFLLGRVCELQNRSQNSLFLRECYQSRMKSNIQQSDIKVHDNEINSITIKMQMIEDMVSRLESSTESRSRKGSMIIWLLRGRKFEMGLNCMTDLFLRRCYINLFTAVREPGQIKLWIPLVRSQAVG